MEHDIDVLNEEMVAAGVRIFVGGLSAASNAKSLRAQPDGKVLVTDGPYLETKEHIGGFWVLEAPTWMRRWRGVARLPSPAGSRSRCARLTDGLKKRVAVDFRSPERLSDNRRSAAALS